MKEKAIIKQTNKQNPSWLPCPYFGDQYGVLYHEVYNEGASQPTCCLGPEVRPLVHSAEVKKSHVYHFTNYSVISR